MDDVVEMDIGFCAVIHEEDFHHIVVDDARDYATIPSAGATIVKWGHAQAWKRI